MDTTRLIETYEAEHTIDSYTNDLEAIFSGLPEADLLAFANPSEVSPLLFDDAQVLAEDC